MLLTIAIILFLILSGTIIYGFLKFFLNLLAQGFEESMKDGHDRPF
jgi:hypothetical protein